MSPDSDALTARRNEIERELKERLERDRQGSPTAGTFDGVALLCLGCRALNGAEARFCTRCGTKFNALLVAARLATGSESGA